jgi:hypothetical protein
MTMTTDPDQGSMEDWLDAAPEAIPDTDMRRIIGDVEDDDEDLTELVAWLREQKWADFCQSLVKFYDERGYLSPKQISAASNMRAKEEAKGKAKAPKVKVTTDGMYLHPDGTVYKVQKAVHGSGRLYAKRLVVPDDLGEPAEFEIEHGGILRLTPEMKMSLEQAQAFGSLYGVCCVCARVLTDETSIAEGIGPVCKSKGWW